MDPHTDKHKKLNTKARRWAALTMELIELSKYKHRIHTSLMKLLDPKRYRVDSATRSFMTRLRMELLWAHQNMTTQKAPTANTTTATETSTTVTPPRPSDANTFEPNAQHIQAMESGPKDPETLPTSLPVLQREQNNTPDNQRYNPDVSTHLTTPWADEPVDDQVDDEELLSLEAAAFLANEIGSTFEPSLPNMHIYPLVLSPHPTPTFNDMTNPTVHTSDHSPILPTTTPRLDPNTQCRFQNNTPDNNKHAPITPTFANGPASISIHDLPLDPSMTCANMVNFPARPSSPLPTYSDFDEFDNFSLLPIYLSTNPAPPLPMENNPDTSNSQHAPVTHNTTSQHPNPTDPHDNMTNEYPTLTHTATEHDEPSESPTAPYDLFQDLTHDSDNTVVPLTPIPGPPGAPPPCTSRTPAPPPVETQDDDGPPDDKGITYLIGGHWKVTVKCNYCGATHTTGSSEHHNPYTELRGMEWSQGTSKSGNSTWQLARCPIWTNGQDCRLP